MNIFELVLIIALSSYALAFGIKNLYIRFKVLFSTKYTLNASGLSRILDAVFWVLTTVYVLYKLNFISVTF